MQFYHSQWEIRNDRAHSTASVGPRLRCRPGLRLRYNLGRKGPPQLSHWLKCPQLKRSAPES